VVLYFTTENLTARMERATAQTADAGLTGLPVTPGPDLVYFTGYRSRAPTSSSVWRPPARRSNRRTEPDGGSPSTWDRISSARWAR
jgi:hypothetical protein